MHPARFAKRALSIAGFLLLHALRFSAGWLWLIVRLRPRAERQAWFGASVLALFRALGATFIKVGQIMSTRPDLIPPHVIGALERLQDDVGPFSFAHVQAIVAEDLGRPLSEVFTDFSRLPVASASVAQVHRARLRDGRVVAVKVRRPGIEALCAFDLEVVRLFARLLELSPSLRLLAPVESVNEFARGIRMQLDFTIEADSNRRFRANFAGDPDVIFPPLCDELCTRRVLVMQFIDGTRLLRFRETGADPKRLARLGFRVMLKMIFEDGFVHADLHPGNILVVERTGREPAIALLDLGLVGELDAAHRMAFARYFAAWARGDGRTMAEILAQQSPSTAIPDYEGFESAVVEFMARYQGRRLGEVEVSRVILDMMSILRRHRVRTDASFTLVNIAIAITEGIGKQLDPDVDLMASALPFFAGMDLASRPDVV